jgi:multisubunit Na+/H+ antiporter MnhE subunit
MILVPLILVLGAVTYALTLASFAWEDLAFGLALSTVVLAMFRNVLLPAPLPSSGRVLTGLLHVPAFLFAVMREIVTGTWQVATFVIGLRELEHPGIVRIPLGPRSPVSEALAGYVITVSPGTYLIDVDEETNEMLVHAMDASDPDAVRQHYEWLFERYERHVVPPLPEGGSR